jgi:hypothetical protein
MPYIVKKNKPIIKEYKGYTYELPNNEYTWIADDWYDTQATRKERELVDTYVQLIDDSVKYITDKTTRKKLILKLIPLEKMPTSEFRHQIIDRFYKLVLSRCSK